MTWLDQNLKCIDLTIPGISNPSNIQYNFIRNRNITKHFNSDTFVSQLLLKKIYLTEFIFQLKTQF